MPNQIIRFLYRPFPKKNPITHTVVGIFYRPLVTLQVANKQQLSRPFNALADSGSDANLFPAELAEMIGIDFKGRRPKTIIGIGGIEIKAFNHKIKLIIGLKEFDTEADFSYQQKVPLLGREGFFNLFQKVIFDNNFNELQLIVKNES